MARHPIIDADFTELDDGRPMDEPEVRPTALLASPTQAHQPYLDSVRADASFIAQLIAAATHMPQARQRRRASPEQALASYRGTAQQPIPAGRRLSVTIT